MEELRSNSDLKIVNDGRPTHISGINIDLTIVSPSLAPECTWNVYHSILSSNHFPVITLIPTRNSRLTIGSNNYNYKKTEWSTYATNEA